MKKTSLFTAVSFVLLSQYTSQANACTAVIVGKSASDNQSSYVARNEDFGGNNNWAKHLTYHPAKTPTGEKWEVGDGLVVPMPKQFYAYSAMPDWDAKTVNDEGKYFEERGVNEFNVAISATNSADVNEKASKADPLVKEGVSEALVTGLILPQVKTAKEGVELLGKYVKEYGAAEGNVLYFSDPNEVWMMEIGSGHHWIAVKVPEDSYTIVANSLRIHNVDLDSDNVLHSDELVKFVTENKLLENFDTKSFNFAKAFGVLGERGNTDRVWLGQKILSPSVEQKPEQAQYPLFMKPDQPISIKDIRAVLASDYAGTEIEKTGKRPIRVESQLESHIIEMRGNAPKPIQPIIWQSFGVLSESLLLPIYNTVTEYPAAFTKGTDMYTPGSAYWQYRGLTAVANTAPEKYYPFIHKTIAFKQKQVDARFKAEDEKLKAETDVEKIRQQSAKFSIDELNNSLAVAQQMQVQILTDLTKSTEKKYTDEEKQKVMALPEEQKKAQ